MSNAELLRATERAACDECRATRELLALLAEVDARRLYLGEGCSSLLRTAPRCSACRSVQPITASKRRGRHASIQSFSSARWFCWWISSKRPRLPRRPDLAGPRRRVRNPQPNLATFLLRWGARSGSATRVDAHSSDRTVGAWKPGGERAVVRQMRATSGTSNSVRTELTSRRSFTAARGRW